MKKWIIGKPDENISHSLAASASVNGLAADILVSRDIRTAEQAAEFFGGGSGCDDMGLLNPFDLPDMQKAADEILAAADRGDRICIYGDYDCDGILSTAALYNYLSETGADIHYFINERSDGYGMNADNIRKLHEQGTRLIITVDNGISAAAEADLCAELGMRLVITDHHTPPPTLPRAAAVVDPHINCPDNHAAFRDMCGCGVVLKLITAMEYGESSIPVEMMSDFAAVATIGDVMPLKGENRTIVRHGMHFLEITENPGMKALIDAATVTADGKKRPFKADSTTAAFTLVPRINASGRMGTAMDAAELFTTDDEERAAELAAKLCRLNTERRSAENSIMQDVSKMSAENEALFDAPVLVISGHGWHKGVIGITAARVCEKTGKPVFMISVDENGNGVGSARAPEGYSIYDALFANAELLTKFGGHKGAGGFSIEEKNIAAFSESLCSAAEGVFFEPTVKAVKQIAPAELTVENIEAMRKLMEPFGEANPEPVFLLAGAAVTAVSPIAGGKYTKVTINYGGNIISFPMFDTIPENFPFSVGDNINIMAVPDINEFNGRKSVTLHISDMRRAGVNQQKLMNAEREYYKFRRGNVPDKRLAAAMIPKREDFAAVYRAFPAERAVPEEYIFNKLCGEYNLCILHIILDVFAETGLISRDHAAGTAVKIQVAKGHKADFSSAATMKRLTAQFGIAE